MVYTKQFWENDNPETPLSGERLSHIEDGIEESSYIAQVGISLGARVVTVGDSITIGGETHSATVDAVGNSWPGYAQWFSNQRFRVVKNAGVSGDRTDQMLARWDTDVLPYAPTVVTILGGTNDINQGIPAATTRTNIAAMVQRALDIGAKPVLITVPPRAQVATYGAQIVALNAWLREFATNKNLLLLDYYSIVVNPATGAMQTSMDQDGTHPNSLGRKLFGQYVASTLDALLPPAPGLLAQANVDAQNLLGNPLFITDSNSDGVADGWSAIGGGSRTSSLVPATFGNWQQWIVSEGTAVGFNRSSSTGFSVGDRVRYVGRFSTTGAGFQVQLAATGGSYQVRPVTLVDQEVTDGQWFIDFVVPPGTTSLAVNITGGIGTHKISQVGVYNLTTMGLV